jgi:hypothetical protein
MTQSAFPGGRQSTFLLAGLAVILGGCLEVEITTEVHTDGTLTRSIVFQGDSANIVRGELLLGVDSLWQRELRQSGPEKTIVAAQRSFGSAAGIAETAGREKSGRLPIRSDLEESFAWFFTTYRYRETWGKLGDPDAVPLTGYLTEQEVQLINRHMLRREPIVSRSDSLVIDGTSDRIEAWQARNRFEKFFSILLDGVRTLHDPGLTEDLVRAKKEELSRHTEHFDFAGGNLDSLADSMGPVVGSSRVGDALEANRESVEAFKHDMRFMYAALSYSYTVRIIMPGSLTATNASLVEGAMASWGNFVTFTSIGDVEMWAESRAVHWWAVLLSAAVLVAGVWRTVAHFRRKKKPAAVE